MDQLNIDVNHAELLRDYAGYEFIQEDMECLLKQFLHLYFADILSYYDFDNSLVINKLEVSAAGAGASKFVFGVSVDGEKKWDFGIRLYNNKGFMKDGDKTYETAKDYNINLETCDQELVEILVDETRIYEEIAQEAKTGIDVRKVWIRFQTGTAKYRDSEYNQYVRKFIYIEDRELKCLFVNLGINAITVGGFIIGFDGKKILERPEFSLDFKHQAIVHICNTMLRTWLFTAQYNDKNQIVGRTIVDLKPAQFVVQSNQTDNEIAAFLIDIGPAENTDNIYTYVKDGVYMKELVAAFAGEMLTKITSHKQHEQVAKQYKCWVYEKIIFYLNSLKQAQQKPTKISSEEFTGLIDEFLSSLKARLS